MSSKHQLNMVGWALTVCLMLNAVKDELHLSAP